MAMQAAQVIGVDVLDTIVYSNRVGPADWVTAGTYTRGCASSQLLCGMFTTTPLAGGGGDPPRLAGRLPVRLLGRLPAGVEASVPEQHSTACAS